MLRIDNTFVTVEDVSKVQVIGYAGTYNPNTDRFDIQDETEIDTDDKTGMESDSEDEFGRKIASDKYDVVIVWMFLNSDPHNPIQCDCWVKVGNQILDD